MLECLIRNKFLLRQLFILDLVFSKYKQQVMTSKVVLTLLSKDVTFIFFNCIFEKLQARLLDMLQQFYQQSHQVCPRAFDIMRDFQNVVGGKYFTFLHLIVLNDIIDIIFWKVFVIFPQNFKVFIRTKTNSFHIKHVFT